MASNPMASIIKKVLLGLVCIVALLAIVSQFLPRNLSVTRDVTINAVPQIIYPLIATPKNWPDWGIWSKRDTSMVTTFSGKDSGVGAKWSWKSASEGDGEMVFIREQSLQSLTYELRFPDFSSVILGTLTLSKINDTSTKVTWDSNIDLGNNPIARYFGLMMDKMLGDDFNASLDGLKTMAEKKAKQVQPPVAAPATQPAATDTTATSSQPK
jgi:Polyketide cyclase / dehydrase and lipid transport